MSISLSLVAVFISDFFHARRDRLCCSNEFAVVVGVAVLVSAVVSLTLIPMLARALKPHETGGWAERSTEWFERGYRWTLSIYERMLDWNLAPSRDGRRGAGQFVLTGFLFWGLPKASFPTRTLARCLLRWKRPRTFPTQPCRCWRGAGEVIKANAAVDTVIVNVFDGNSGRLFVSLKPRRDRPPMDKVVESLRRELRAVPGISAFLNPLQNCAWAGGLPRRATSSC